MCSQKCPCGFTLCMVLMQLSASSRTSSKITRTTGESRLLGISAANGEGTKKIVLTPPAEVNANCVSRGMATRVEVFFVLKSR